MITDFKLYEFKRMSNGKWVSDDNDFEEQETYDEWWLFYSVDGEREAYHVKKIYKIYENINVMSTEIIGVKQKKYDKTMIDIDLKEKEMESIRLARML
jgi:hypothetical protein